MAKATLKKPVQLKPVLICTQHRGVFYAEVDPRYDLDDKTLTNLKNCRMAIYFGTTGGVMELAATGPTSKSKIGAAADIDALQDVTAVFAVTAEAQAKWIAR